MNSAYNSNLTVLTKDFSEEKTNTTQKENKLNETSTLIFLLMIKIVSLS